MSSNWQTLIVAPTIGQEDSELTVTVVLGAANDNARIRKWFVAWKGSADWQVAFDAEIHAGSAASAVHIFRGLFPSDFVCGVRES